ncbi:hypothetical protein NQ314_000556, partial [Rhamnusium bicolor]
TTAPSGKVQGSWKVSFDGRRYAAFEGIPYAKPPIADLRFQSLLFHICDYYNYFSGDEDCLYLNIFVPTQGNDQQALDVVIHIHGGGFMFGSGHDFLDPKYVMDRDIILVTINYRLGVLGFLSTGDEVLPGNNGLKDQITALKWIQQNIASFGGNPNSVTLTGFSAGGVSVHLHYISPLSKGLFHRGMSMSGVATNDWAIEENPLEYAKNLANLVGCPISNTKSLVECLKTRPASLLVEKTKDLYKYPPTPVCLLKPVIEKKSEHSFLFEHPYKSLVEKNVLDVPWITSVTRDDGMIISLLLYNKLDDLNKKWTEIGPDILEYRNLRHRTDISNKIKDYYLGKDGQFNDNSLNQFKKMCTDKFFTINAESSAKLQSKATKSPVYFYYFNYDKGENTFTNLFTSDDRVS